MTMLHGLIMILFAWVLMFIKTVRSICLCAFYVVCFVLRGSEFFENNCDLSIVFKTEESGISVFSLFSSAMMILLKPFLKSELLFPF